MKEMFKCKFLLSDYYPAGFTSKSSSASGRQRHFYDEVQLVLLDAEFTRDPFPNREGRRRIAQLIGVPEKSIMVWHFDLYCYIFRYLRLTSSPSYSWILFGPSGNFISGTNQLLDVRALFDVATSIRMGCSQLPTGGH